MQPMLRVAITGAEGVVGTVLRTGFAGRYEVRSLTLTPQAFPSTIVDVRDYQSVLSALRGCDAVIHLAAAAVLDAGWDDVLSTNIVGTRNVFEAAREAGVKTVVFASSGHVIGATEERDSPALYELDDPRVYDEHAELAPDSLYAVGKILGESLGRYYAHAHHLRVICVRLGTVLPDDDPQSEHAGKGRSATMSRLERYPRIRAKWLSHRDCCQLFRRCIESNNVDFTIVYGTSNNPRQIWSLDSARKLLGYDPQDSAPVK